MANTLCVIKNPKIVKETKKNTGFNTYTPQYNYENNQKYEASCNWEYDNMHINFLQQLFSLFWIRHCLNLEEKKIEFLKKIKFIWFDFEFLISRRSCMLGDKRVRRRCREVLIINNFFVSTKGFFDIKWVKFLVNSVIIRRTIKENKWELLSFSIAYYEIFIEELNG